MNKILLSLLVILPVLLAGGASLFASEAYVIGPDDVLEIKFWQDETERLDANVKVRQDGMISLDIIGEIEAAGKTTAELEKNIVRQISRYNKAISQAVVRVIEYGFQKVFISGQVLIPGKYTFEIIPNLWTLINEAGGVTENGDLTRVLVIRGGDEAGQVEIVNVAEAVASGTIGNLPKIRTGDAVEVSGMPGGLPARTLSLPSQARNIFYVTGEVRSPGPLTLEENIDLLTAIAMAGGPTENANLTNVSIISQDGYNAQVARFDLKKYSETGMPGRYFIRPEDNIILDRKKGGFLGIGSVTDVVTILGAATSALLIYEMLKPSEE